MTRGGKSHETNKSRQRWYCLLLFLVRPVKKSVSDYVMLTMFEISKVENMIEAKKSPLLFPKAQEPGHGSAAIRVIWEKLSELTDTLNSYSEEMGADFKRALYADISGLNKALNEVRSAGMVLADVGDVADTLSIILEKKHKIWLKNPKDKDALVEICIRQGGLEIHKILNDAAESMLANMSYETYKDLEKMRGNAIMNATENVLTRLVILGAIDNLGNHSKRDLDVEQEWNLS